MSDIAEQLAKVTIPEIIMAAIASVPPELKKLPARRLQTKLKPDKTTHRLRAAFWVEYHKAMSLGRRMMTKNIYEGICEASYFHHCILPDPLCMAWILAPPADYLVGLEVALNDSMELISDAMFEGRIVDDDGKIDSRALTAVTKTLEVVHAIVRGPIVQKIETKSLNVNVDAKQVNEKHKSSQELLAYAQSLIKELSVGKEVEVIKDIVKETE